MRIMALGLFLAVITHPAAAQEPRNGRYAFIPAEAGTLRLDTQTGEVSLCSEAGGNLACRVLPDEAGDRSDAVSRLRDDVEALKERVAALEAERQSSVDILADAEAMDRVMDLTDQMMRRFFGLVQDFRRDMERDEL